MRRAALPIAVVILSAVPLSYQFFNPLITTADYNTSAFAQPARNFLRYGLLGTRLGLVVNLGDQQPEHPSYNAHHPPLAALGASAAFLALGVRDWVARVYPACCSLGTSLLVFLLWRRHRGEWPAALAAAVMISLPAYGHFGKMLGEETPTLFLGLLTIFLYRRWKDAPAEVAGRYLGGIVSGYVAGCLSGWAAFHAGPILMLDAALTLRKRRRIIALSAVGLAGLTTFALVVAHLAALTGSTKEIIHAATYRTVASASGLDLGSGRPSWIQQEAGHFVRLYGVEAAALALVGVLAGLVALARRRVQADAVATILILAAFGVAHPLIFRWAAYMHDWLLFHLLPVLAIAGAEGILFVTGLLAGLFRLFRAPAPAVAAVSVLAVALPLGHSAVAGARGLHMLATETPRYAWPLLGMEMNRSAPEGTQFMSNFMLIQSPLVFYADRPYRLALTRAKFDEVLTSGPFSIYLRDVNIPLEADLEARLEAQPCREIASYRLYDLQAPRSPGPCTVAGALPSSGLVSSGSALEAEFEGAVRLTGYQAIAPSERPAPIPLWRAFFGSDRDSVTSARLIKVASTWSPVKPDLPNWSMLAAITRNAGGGVWEGLPLVTAPEETHPLISRWRGQAEFRLESDFLVVDGATAGIYEVRFALYDGGRPVKPVLPGPSSEGLKSVIAGKIPLLPGAIPAAGDSR